MKDKNARIIILVSLSVALIMLAILAFWASNPQSDAAGTNGGNMPHVIQVSLPPTVTPTQMPTLDPVSTPSPTLSPSPTPSPTPTPDPRPLSGLVIGVDPGHQAHSNRDLEPVAPDSSEQKKKVSSGTSGVVTGIREHEVNLAVGLLLQELLEEAGATVVMTRETADVDISNVERAGLFNEHSVDLGLRLHCNGTEDQSVHGAFMLVPVENPYKDDCIRAAEVILAAYGEETGISIHKGLTYRSDQTGFNWCERPIINIEMGHMSNPEEDRKLTDPDFQIKMAEGLYVGILDYFAHE